MSSWYDRLPASAQNLLCDVWGLKLRHERFNSTFEHRLRQLRESEWWAPERIAEYQDAQTRALVREAYEHVPFHRDRMRAAGITPADIRGVSDLALLPVMTKADVREHGERIRSTRRIDTVTMHTSGTTGTALEFEVDRSAVPFRWAVWWRHRTRFGVHPGEWHINFTGKQVVPPSTRKAPFWRRSRPLRQYLVNMHHLTPHRIESIVRDLDARGPRFWSGYPSIVHAYCRLILEARLTLQRPPQFVFTGAENVLVQQRRDIGSVTGATLSEQYGFTEGCGNASHCEGLVYHEDFEYGVLECVDSETLDDGGTRGRIVATGFASHGFIFLRYDVGDIGVWAPASHRCACGRASRVMTGIDGRIDDYVITPEGRRIMRFDYVFKDTRFIREAQVVQERLGEIVINVVLEPGTHPSALDRVRELIAQWISPGLDVRFNIVPELPRGTGGKLKAVVSRLPDGLREGVVNC